MQAATVAIERAKPSGLKSNHLIDIWPGDAQAFEKFREQVKSVFQDMGILCLSEVPDNMLMWSHYANHHRGFCVEYDFTASSKLKEFAYKVQYSDDMPSLSAADFVGPKKEATTDALWLTKASCWAYEREWRVMMTNGDRAYNAPSRIKSIIFGARMPETDRMMIETALRHTENIKFKESVIGDQSFVVGIKDLGA